MADEIVHLRRARDLMDRAYAQPLDVPAMARAAHASPARFARRFRYGVLDCAFDDPSGNVVRIGQTLAAAPS